MNIMHNSSLQKADVLSILDAGIDAAMVESSMKKVLCDGTLKISKKKINLKHKKIFVISIGKASYSMAKTLSSMIKVERGIIVLPQGHATVHLPRFELIHSGHPVPNNHSVLAAKKILSFLNQLKPIDFIIFLISGGSSSLVSLPYGITLQEKQSITQHLLKCGANIAEINCVRKHLSQIKGGKLVENIVSNGISLILSDVVGDDLSVIASGITYCDKTTFDDALRILQKYDLIKSTPRHVINRLQYGSMGVISDTPKRSSKIKNLIIMNNHNCLLSMKRHAESLGYRVLIIKDVTGDVKSVAKRLADEFFTQNKNCIIFGGEPTICVKGKGKGGRNQELVLRLASLFSSMHTNAIVGSIGTDGVDGNTKYAGAVYSSTQDLSAVEHYLEDNDSNAFFQKHGGLVYTGYTGTNLMDVGVILRQ